MPWATISATDISAHDFLWWAYGPAGVGSNADGTSVAFKRFYDSSSPMWGVHKDPIAHFAAVNASASGRANDFLYAKGGAVPSPTAGMWTFNQWGVCLFPEQAWVLETFKCCAVEPFTATAEGGICRAWSVFDASIFTFRDSRLDKASPFDVCQNPGIDGFSLIMGAFGAFMKIMEPIPRMKPRTDGHQKTVILLIIVISSIPSFLGVATFRFGCYSAISEYAAGVGAETMYGAGAWYFFLSLLLLIPITGLHMAVPSPVSSGHHSARSTRKLTSGGYDA